MKRVALVALLLGLSATRAEAFCGFYVNGAGGAMYNDATQVVMMREGTRTVLSMQNSYQGPVKDFAMVVPVPVVLQEADVKTLEKDVFSRIDAMGSPRLVEYWEQDPCPSMDDGTIGTGKYGTLGHGSGTGTGYGVGAGRGGVKIEAQFTVGEYQIVILSATDSSALDTWLRDEKYAIPDGAEPLLRPYVEAGSKFFVAKVDPKKVKFDDEGRAQLSPLRFHYDSEELVLPIRLGLAASPGTQDLVVNILSPEGRFQTSNYKNVTIPTNLDVKDEVRNRFAEFYAALLDRTLEKNPGAVVTEYAWPIGSCDPCPGNVRVNSGDLITLGGDVLNSSPDGSRGAGNSRRMVLTRLHARYGKFDVADDLHFTKAEPIVGGREHVIDQATGKLEEGAQPSTSNNFQGRYAIRHEWTGPIECANPIRNVWGGPPNGQAYEGASAARDLAHAPRGQVKLGQMVRSNIPELGIRAAGAGPVGPDPKRSGVEPSQLSRHGEGCGCQSNQSFNPLVVLVALLLLRRKR